MKTKLTNSKVLQFFTLALFFSLLATSCVKDEIGVDLFQQSKGQDNGDFFVEYAGEYQDLFSEEVWDLMATDPEMAMLKLTGITPDDPNGSGEWIPYVMRYQKADISISPHFKDNLMDGLVAESKAEGNFVIKDLGFFDDFMETEQMNYFGGGADGEALSTSEKFTLHYNILEELETPKKETSQLDAVLHNDENTGMFKETSGFALRKALVDLNAPLPGSLTNMNGLAEIIVLGYILKTD